MKFIVFAVLFLAVASFARADDGNSSQEILVTFEHLRKLIGVCSGSQEKFIDALAELQRCEKEVHGPGLTKCEALNRYSLNCTRLLISCIDECYLSLKKREVVAFRLRSVLSGVQYLSCEDDRDITEFTCIFGSPAGHTEQLDECKNKWDQLIVKYQNEQSLSEICRNTEYMRVCVQAQLNLTCKNANTRTYYTGLFDAIIASCSTINV